MCLCQVLLPLTTAWKSIHDFVSCHAFVLCFILLCVTLNKTALGFSRYNLPQVDPTRASSILSIISLSHLWRNTLMSKTEP